MVFGSGSGFAASMDLSTLDGSNGFRLDGIDGGDRSGFSVSTAGDVNGDGYDDIMVGAYWADPGGDSYAGETYVVFGSGGGFAASLDLDTLDGNNGFRLDGIDVDDLSGRSVSTAGDVNGDGYADMLVGASGDFTAIVTGETYVVFGGDFTGTVTHVGTTAAETLAGDGSANVMVAGMGNDTVIGGGGADVIYAAEGDDTITVSDTAFARIDGGSGDDTLTLDSSGLTLDLTNVADPDLVGIETIDITGSGNNTLTLNVREVLNSSNTSNTLTVIGDAGDSVRIGPGWTTLAPTGGKQQLSQGAATLLVSLDVVIVSPMASLNLSTLDGSNGFRLDGIDEEDLSGTSVSAAGDINGDGYDDILIGARWADPGGNIKAGETYLVFGSGNAFAAALDLDVLDGNNGFRMDGIGPSDFSGWSVSTAGDFNGDGLADMLVGAKAGDPGGSSSAGETYLVFGSGDGFCSQPGSVDTRR